MCMCVRGGNKIQVSPNIKNNDEEKLCNTHILVLYADISRFALLSPETHYK